MWEVRVSCPGWSDMELPQMEHASYEYSTWNWWSWPKIIDSGEFGPKIEMCANFYEIWHSGHFFKFLLIT